MGMSVYPTVRLHGTPRLPLDGFSCNMLFEDFLNICRENSSSLKPDKNTGNFT